MEIVLRVAIIYAFLLVALRLMGKREFSQLSPTELVTLLIIPEMLTEALNLGESALTTSVIAVSTLLSLVFLTSVLAYRFPGFGKWTEGEPVMLVRDGTLISPALHRERVSPEEILSEMRKAGLERLEQVKWGVLEPDGKLSFISRPSERGPSNPSGGANDDDW
jgi:uncharacterized membrane protein YcaP (DUF421 family)